MLPAIASFFWEGEQEDSRVFLTSGKNRGEKADRNPSHVTVVLTPRKEESSHFLQGISEPVTTKNLWISRISVMQLEGGVVGSRAISLHSDL